MEDAFNLPTPKENPAPLFQDVVITPPDSHKSVEQAIQHLNQLIARQLTYEGKNGMNPHLWLHQQGIKPLLNLLASGKCTTQDVDTALSIQFEEPKVSLFTSNYEPIIETRRTPPSH